MSRSLFAALMDGFASIGAGMTTFGLVPQTRSLDEMQTYLAENYGVIGDDAEADESDWKAVGDDMKDVLNLLKHKR